MGRGILLLKKERLSDYMSIQKIYYDINTDKRVNDFHEYSECPYFFDKEISRVNCILCDERHTCKLRSVIFPDL